MLFNYLLSIQALGATAVLAGESEVGFGRRSDLRMKYTDLQVVENLNGSSHCQAQSEASLASLLSFDHHHHHSHNQQPLADTIQTCPKVATEPTEWSAGAAKQWAGIPLCTRSPKSYDAPNSTASGAESQLKEQEPYCVFTSTSFRSGRGISILTQPSIAKKFMTMPGFNLEGSPELYQATPPPYEIKYVSGKGMGVIANRTIFRGERLFAYPVVGIFHNNAFLGTGAKEYGLRTKLIERGVDQLPDDAREKVHALIGEAGAKNVLVGQLTVNTFAEEFWGVDHSIAAPETARMNHDCRPNAMYYFDSQTLVHYTHATRTIYAGEEITITYIDPLQSRAERREQIQNTWGFDCTCSLCTQPPYITDASDERISAINRISEKLQKAGKSAGEQKDVDSEEVEMAETLVSLYEQERLYAHIADAWRLAAEASKKVGKKWEALKWARQAEEGLLVFDGPRYPSLVRAQEIIRELNFELGMDEEE